MSAEDRQRYQRELQRFERLNPGYTAQLVRATVQQTARQAAKQQAQRKRETLQPLAAIKKPRSAWQLFLLGCAQSNGANFSALSRDQKVRQTSARCCARVTTGRRLTALSRAGSSGGRGARQLQEADRRRTQPAQGGGRRCVPLLTPPVACTVAALAC